MNINRKLIMNRLALICGLLISINSFGQKTENTLEKVFRVNAINPGVEFEFPISKKSILAFNPGVGYHPSNSNLDYTSNGYTYYISPFLDLSYKMIYNQEKRDTKGRNNNYNSGNYWGLRFLTNFKELESKNLYRIDDISFELGPTWGIKRSYGKIHFLFDIGSIYYFDTKGNNGFFPIMLQLNIGLNLKKW